MPGHPGRRPRARQRLFCLLLIGCGLTETAGAADAAEDDALQPIEVRARRIAIDQPASTYAALATALRFDPQIDLQARGLPEGQADITVRGGLFENTGFRLGAVAVYDPQTGHYAVELPIDPAMLTPPRLLTDVDHAALAFNATSATVAYTFHPIRSGGSTGLGAGSDNLRFGHVRVARSVPVASGAEWGTAVSAAASRADGTLPNGDHEFARLTAHLQRRHGPDESQFILGYQDKFFGWPGAYTGFASLPETDDTQIGLALLNHRREIARGWWEAALVYRWLEDDYDFDRRTVETGVPGSFEHATRSLSTGAAGVFHAHGLDWSWSGQMVADRLVRSTDLTGGDFNSRTYFSFALLPGGTLAKGARWSLGLRGGLRADLSNRDEDAVMPVAGLMLESSDGELARRVRLEMTRTSQLPGYTALKSPPRGLFGGNPELGRQYADNLTLTGEVERGPWRMVATGFVRNDDDLVDWTYREGAPFVRQANAVDLEVTGLEVIGNWSSPALELLGGYAWLDKDKDYGSAAVDASFYALNHAVHRFTFGLIWRLSVTGELRFDAEYRRQRANPLRTGSERAFLGSLAWNWRPRAAAGLGLDFVVDNLTDSDFQEFPGTPPMGRQGSLLLRYDW